MFTPESNGARIADSGAIEKERADGAGKGGVGNREAVKVFIIHEDDFYKPDDQYVLMSQSQSQPAPDVNFKPFIWQNGGTVHPLFHI